MTDTTTRWPTADDQAWGDRLRLRLGLDGAVPAGTADEAVADARDACLESGRPAVELFGDADTYAHEVARDRVPVEDRASVDLAGGTPRTRWTLLLLTAGASTTVVGIALLLTSGWTAPASPAHVALFVGVLLSWVAILWGLLDRRAGLLRRGWGSWSAGALGIVASSTAAVSLRDRDPLVDVPVLAVLAVGVALTVVAINIKPPAPAEDTSRDIPADAWFERLGGLLRGRYYLSRATVRQQVADARAHWEDSGAPHPHDEFGSPEVYALELLDDSPAPKRRQRLATAWFYTVFAGLCGYNAVSAVLDDETGAWGVVWRCVAVALFVGMATQTWREHLRDRHQARRPRTP